MSETTELQSRLAALEAENAALREQHARQREESDAWYMEAMREGEERLRTAIEASPDAFFIFEAAHDPAGSIVDLLLVQLNSRGADLISRTHEEVIGRRLSSLATVKPFDKLFDKCRQVLQAHTIELVDVSLDVGGEKPSWLRVKLVPFGTSVFVSAFDITSLKRIEEDRARFFALSTDYLCTCNREGRFMQVNPAFYKSLGYGPDELITKPFMDFVHPDDVEKTTQAYQAILRFDVSVTNFVNRYRCKDGSYRSLEWSTVPLGGTSSFHAIARDVTDVLRTEEELKFSRQQYRVLFQDNPLPMWVFDAETIRFVAVNAAATKLYGIPEDEFLAMKVSDLSSTTEQRSLGELEKDLPPGVGYTSISRHRLRDGRVIDVETTLHDVVFNGRKAVHVLARDVSEILRIHSLITAQKHLFELAAKRESAKVLLEEIGLVVERQIFDVRCSFLLVNEPGTAITHVSSPSLPPEYTKAIDGLKPGPTAGACGTAIHRKERVISRDIETDPLWEQYREIALQHGLRACWSIPILAPTGQVLGTIACYARTVREPNASELEVLDVAADVASIALWAERIDQKQRQLETQVHQDQKLNSLGVLAGGIAHDFNNILAGMLGNASLAMSELPPDSPIVPNLRQVEALAVQASALTRQMLTYSGKEHLVIQRQDINALIRDMMNLLKISVSKSVNVALSLAPDTLPVDGEPSQLRQIIMNLVANASDAVGENFGVITISTGLFEANSDYLANCMVSDAASPGEFVFIDVTDNGLGMTNEVMQRVFDPFFTTKTNGKGLGLSSVLGIIRGHRGAIHVSSERGIGTSFRVLLPPAGSGLESAPNKTPQESEAQRAGKILVVDDEESIRTVTKSLLEKLGYEVIVAKDGYAGIEAYKVHWESIRAVLLDMTMPGIKGNVVFREIRRIDPNARIILMSGYTAVALDKDITARENVPFLAKPFKLSELKATLEKALTKGAKLEERRSKKG